MLAAILETVPTEELVVADDVTLRDIGPGDVRVKIAHSGVCHSDLSAMNGTIPQEPPAVLGHEGAGVVVDVGDGVTHVAPGDHVIIAFSPPCGACPFCTGRHQPNLCMTGLVSMSTNMQFRQGDRVVGSMTGCGTFAEETIVPGVAAIKIDDDIPLDVAALVGCGVTTGVGAVLNTAKVTPGSSVLIIGAGGVGVAAIRMERGLGLDKLLRAATLVEKIITPGNPVTTTVLDTTQLAESILWNRNEWLDYLATALKQQKYDFILESCFNYKKSIAQKELLTLRLFTPSGTRLSKEMSRGLVNQFGLSFEYDGAFFNSPL